MESFQWISQQKIYVCNFGWLAPFLLIKFPWPWQHNSDCTPGVLLAKSVLNQWSTKKTRERTFSMRFETCCQLKLISTQKKTIREEIQGEIEDLTFCQQMMVSSPYLKQLFQCYFSGLRPVWERCYFCRSNFSSDLIIFKNMNAKRQQNEAIGSPQYVWLLKAWEKAAKKKEMQKRATLMIFIVMIILTWSQLWEQRWGWQ